MRRKRKEQHISWKPANGIERRVRPTPAIWELLPSLSRVNYVMARVPAKLATAAVALTEGGT